MVTKEEFREEIKKLEDRLGDKIVKQGEGIGDLEARVSNQVELMVIKEEFREKIGKIETDVAGVKFTQKLLISLYLSILGILGAIFVKIFFLS